MKNTKLITIVLAMLMIISSLTILANIQTASASNITIKSAQVNLCNILPGHSSYVPNWLSLLQGMGVNTLRIGDGGEGRMGYNIATDANWAQTLENILTTITGIDRNGAGTSTGITKVYWQSMGDDNGGAFGIPDYGATVGLLDINTAKYYIDKLAGNNVYGHNFVSDTRILSWNIGNEQKLDDANGNLNSQYYWIIQLMDYIRSYGGHVACNAPYVGSWNGNPSIIAPLFYGHADYYEIHYYGTWELGTPSYQGGYYLGNGQFNWAGWSTMVQNKLSSDVAAASPWYDSNHILLGEFGLSFPTIFNHPEVSITPQMQADYFTYYFQALNAMGTIKCTSAFEAFMGQGHYYGVISGGTPYDTYSKGTPYPAYYIIAANYAGYSTSTPIQDPIPTPTPTPTPISSPPQSSGSTFGTTTVGGTSTTFYTGIARAVQYTPTSSGTITDLMLYLTSSGAGGHAQVAVYADNGGKPGTLLAKSSSDTINSNGWHDFTNFNTAITAWTPYWLAFQSDSSNLLFYYNNGGANYYQGNSGSYGTFPNTYGTLYSGSYSPSIYATYTSSGSSPTPSPAPSPSGSTFGTTTVGGTSTTFYTGIARAVQYTPTSSGTITDLMLYLTSSGAGGHAQVAVYADNGGKPGTLLAKSSSDTINSNGWHDFTNFNTAITAWTPYWLAFQSDSSNLLFYYNNGGANYYQGNSGSYGTFPNTYGTLYSGSYSPSIYATYR